MVGANPKFSEEYIMTKDDLGRAWRIATRVNRQRGCLDWADGFGLSDYQPKHITIEMLADLISYQCWNFSGSWDQAALNEIAEHGKRKFIVID